MSLPAPLELGWRTTAGHCFTLAEAGVELHGGPGEHLLLRPPTALLAERMVGLDDGMTVAAAAQGLSPDELARLHYYVWRLADVGVVAFDLWSDGHHLATLLPRRRGFRPGAFGPQRLRLSRFSYIRRDGDATLLAAPDAACEALLVDRRAPEWVLTGPCGDEAGAALVRVLAHAGLLEAADAAEPPERRTWEFHDRLLHRASRFHDDFVARGGTYRFGEDGDPTPPVRPRHRGPARALPVPALEESRPLRDVMEARRSDRAPAGPPPTAGEISELLYRVARTTAVDPGTARATRRPYPSGGALHELEFYVAARDCQGLSPGLHHYRGDEHELVEVAGADAAAPLLEQCAQAWQRPGEPPPVVIVLATRLPRLAWKYERIAYRLTLLDAGVAIANLYLVATDMGLACCAAGSGNSETFSAALGESDWVETSIAEFGLGHPTPGAGTA